MNIPDPPGKSPREKSRRVFFISIIVLINFIVLEIFSYTLAQTFPQFMSNAEDYAEDFDNYENYRSFSERIYNPEIGWENFRNKTRYSINCLGNLYPLTMDQNGARSSPVPGEPEIIFVGDSYTQGRELLNLQDYPSRLSVLLGLPVVNYGVSGFDPYQSTLLLKQKIPLHPQLKIAVLGIMYENIRRLRTRYRYVMHYSVHSAFMYKPWLDVVNNKVVVYENPNRELAESSDELKKRAINAINNDFYAPEPFKFPYTLGLINALMKKSIQIRFLEIFRPMYRQYYNDDEYSKIMKFAVRNFIEQSRHYGLRPIVLFIPGNRRDTTSPDKMTREINSQYGKNLVYNAGNMDIDWDLYNILPGKCHPSEYGQESLARFLVQIVESVMEEETGS